MAVNNWTGSDFELDYMGIKFDGEEAYSPIQCVGSLEEDMGVRTITKKCRGVVKKKRSKGTGEGTLKISAHIPWAVYTKAYGMELSALVSGVKAYGQNSVHKEFSLVMHVLDEDNNEKLKAYPKCIVNTGIVRKIENGAEEVAELELEVGVMPDDYGNGLYEAAVEDIEDETVVETWLTAFTPELVWTKTVTA